MNYCPLEDKSEQDLRPSEDYEALLSSSGTFQRKQTRRNFVLLSAVLAPIASFCLLALGAWIGSKWFANPNDICPGHVQHYCKLLLQFLAPGCKTTTNYCRSSHLE